MLLLLLPTREGFAPRVRGNNHQHARDFPRERMQTQASDNNGNVPLDQQMVRALGDQCRLVCRHPAFYARIRERVVEA